MRVMKIIIYVAIIYIFITVAFKMKAMGMYT